MPSVQAPEPLPPPQPGAEEIRRAAEEVLARPEFREPPRSLYQRALDFASERLGEALEAVFSGGRGAVIAWLIVGLVLVFVVYLVARGLRLSGRRAAGRDDPVAIDAGRPPEHWDAAAEAFEAKGEWRAALRCRHRSLIATLAAAGIIDEIPGRTAGEYRMAVAATVPAAAALIDPATDLFERAWYGDAPTGPDELHRFRELADRVLTGASR